VKICCEPTIAFEFTMNLSNLPTWFQPRCLSLVVAVLFAAGGRSFAAAADVPLPLKLPLPSFIGTPDDLPKGEHIEPPKDKPRAVMLAPNGVWNVALNRKVISSDKNPISGNMSQITDGIKEAVEDNIVELHKNVQWVQIDLENDYDICAVVLWHNFREMQFCRCVVVQAADDPDFTVNVRTFFNNDYENIAGLGLGKDKQYFETHEGKLIVTKGAKARYLRFYSKGSNVSALNYYTEIEVWGLRSTAADVSLAPLSLELPMPGFK